jgi:predicted nucleic acid-binding protein
VTTVVVDASVVIKWFLPEIHSEAAQRLLRQSSQYFAPDLLYAEIGNVVWKKVRRGELTEKQGTLLIEDLSRIAIESVPTRTMIADAYAVALASRRTVYDALYITLAVRLNANLITADERLWNALAGIHELRSHVRLLQTLPE